MKKIALLAISFILAGCMANSDERISSSTAYEIDQPEQNIVLSNIEKGAFETKWIAKVKTSGATYKCLADDMLRNVKCKETK